MLLPAVRAAYDGVQVLPSASGYAEIPHSLDHIRGRGHGSPGAGVWFRLTWGRWFPSPFARLYNGGPDRPSATWEILKMVLDASGLEPGTHVNWDQTAVAEKASYKFIEPTLQLRKDSVDKAEDSLRGLFPWSFEVWQGECNAPVMSLRAARKLVHISLGVRLAPTSALICRDLTTSHLHTHTHTATTTTMPGTVETHHGLKKLEHDGWIVFQLRRVENAFLQGSAEQSFPVKGGGKGSVTQVVTLPPKLQAFVGVPAILGAFHPATGDVRIILPQRSVGSALRGPYVYGTAPTVAMTLFCQSRLIHLLVDG